MGLMTCLRCAQRVLSIQQTGKCPKLLCEEADVVIRDIKEIVGVIEDRVLKS
jgi:soluble P-type ATPase